MSFSIEGNFSKERDWTGWQQLADKGEIGIGAGGAEVHFDNFMITGDEIQDNSKSIESKDKIATLWSKIRK